MKNSNTVLIDKNPGRNSQTYGIARELGTDLGLIHEPSVGVVGNRVTNVTLVFLKRLRLFMMLSRIRWAVNLGNYQ